MPSKLLFLPGASGDTCFWEPVSNLLAYPAERLHIGWPGFGPTSAEPGVRGIGDLVAKVIGEIQGSTALIAQSMGGLIAVLAAFEKPLSIPHEGASGGCVTISVGVAVAVPGADNSADELLQLADKALYDAKANGRNQVQRAVGELRRR